MNIWRAFELATTLKCLKWQQIWNPAILNKLVPLDPRFHQLLTFVHFQFVSDPLFWDKSFVWKALLRPSVTSRCKTHSFSAASALTPVTLQGLARLWLFVTRWRTRRRRRKATPCFHSFANGAFREEENLGISRDLNRRRERDSGSQQRVNCLWQRRDC